MPASMTGRAFTVVLAAVLCLAFGDVASAAVINFGPGRHPDVAIDENSTAHVVWDAQEDGADRLFYCQVPRTADACTNLKTLNPPLEAIGRSTHVFATGGGRILIASVRCCGASEGTNVMESTDGGATFSPPRVAGNYTFANQVVLAPGNTLLAGSNDVQSAPIAGPAATARAELNPGFTVPTDHTVGVHKDATAVAVHSDGDDMTFHTAPTSSNLNAAASWTGPTALPAGGDIDMESNPRGVELIHEGGTPGKRTWGTRMFDGTGFTAYNRITEEGDPIFTAIGGSPFKGGSFHAAWVDNRSPNRLRWARSPNGFNWSESYVALSGDEADNAYSLRVAGAPDGGGFAVWDQNSPSGNSLGIHLPDKGKGPPIDTVKFAQYTADFLVPFPCTPAGKKLAVGLGTKGKVIPSKERVNATRVEFTMRGTKVVDKKPPWRASFSTAGQAPGSGQSLRAFIYYRKLSGGKTKVALLKATGVICS